MTRSEIIAERLATLRASVSDGTRYHAQTAFAHTVYAALATPGCEAQGVRLADLPHIAERVAEMADAHEALRAERDEARGEVATLRAQVVEYVRNGVSIHKAADAARRAERADVVAELRRLYAAQRSEETPVAATLDILIGLFESGTHEGAATPK